MDRCIPAKVESISFPVGLPPLKKTSINKGAKKDPPRGGGSFLAVFGFLGKPTGKLQVESLHGLFLVSVFFNLFGIKKQDKRTIAKKLPTKTFNPSRY